MCPAQRALISIYANAPGIFRDVLFDLRKLLRPLRPKVGQLDVFREIKFHKRFHVANVSSCSGTD
jgi:hypothetical protein